MLDSESLSLSLPVVTTAAADLVVVTLVVVAMLVVGGGVLVIWGRSQNVTNWGRLLENNFKWLSRQK